MRLPLPVRRVASRLVRRVPVRVRSGPNRGARWSLAASGRGFWSGRFEEARVAALARLVKPGDRFWDCGAHQGYVSLLAARRVGPEGSLVCVEPSGYNRWYLERHLAWNGVADARVVAAALGAEDGTAPFREQGSSVRFRLGDGDQTVPVRSVASLVREGATPPTFLKLDVEGAEASVLKGAADYLSASGAVFVALHSRESWRQCAALLRAADYRLLPSARLRRYRRRSGSWNGDPDLLALGPERVEPSGLRRLSFFRKP